MICRICLSDKEFYKSDSMCKDCRKARSAQYRLEHPEKTKKALQNWYLKNSDAHKTKMKSQRKRQNELRRIAYKNNPDKRLSQNRARLYNAIGFFTTEEWLYVKELWGNVCLRCGSKEHITRDHVVPLSLGGLNVMDNLQPLCLSCNSAKGDTIADYRIT